MNLMHKYTDTIRYQGVLTPSEDLILTGMQKDYRKLLLKTNISYAYGYAYALANDFIILLTSGKQDEIVKMLSNIAEEVDCDFAIFYFKETLNPGNLVVFGNTHNGYIPEIVEPVLSSDFDSSLAHYMLQVMKDKNLFNLYIPKLLEDVEIPKKERVGLLTNKYFLITLKERFETPNGFYIEANSPTRARLMEIRGEQFYHTDNCIVEAKDVITVTPTN
jgi:hypothetical protein